MNAGVVVFILLVGLSFLGLPIFLSIAAASMIGMAMAGFPGEAMPQKVFLGLNSSALLSIPFFVLAGNLMSRGITQRLVNVANVLLGRVRGGLGCVTVAASALFGAISGSNVATVAAIGGMTIPAMKKEGYDPDYAAALASAASLLGPLVPPSIALIVYSSLTDTSVRTLFTATILPAGLCFILFLGYCLWYGRKHNLPKQPKKSAAEAGAILKDSIWALLMPVLVLGSIYSGICTVTESAALACIYATLIGFFGYRTLTLKDLKEVLYSSAISIATIMVLIGMSKVSAYIVVSSQLPQLFMEAMTTMVSSKVVLFLIINVIFLILGCLMEGTSILVMMVPLLMEVLKAFDINLIHFGILACINIYIGAITPPVGVSLLMGTKIGNTTMGGTFRAMMPFLIIALAVLMLVTYFPPLSLALPGLL